MEEKVVKKAAKKEVSMPSLINLGCYRYNVLLASLDEIRRVLGSDYPNKGTVFGCINNEDQLILVLKENTPQCQRSTLLHELVHAIVDSKCIPMPEETAEMEALVDGIATGVYEVLKRNPRLVSWIMEEKK